MFFENFKKFILYYGKGQYYKLAGFTIMSLIAGFLEFLGVALIYPFIMLIIQPDAVNFSKYVNIDNNMVYGLLLGFGVLLIFILKNLFIIFYLYLQGKFVADWKQKIIFKYMYYYLYAPYKLSMQSSPNDKLYVMGTLVSQVVEQFMLRVMNLFTNAVIIVMVLLLLLIKFLVPALITIVFVGIAVLLQNKYFKSRTGAISKEISDRYMSYQTSMLQNINNIKEIKIQSSESVFCDEFKTASESLKSVQIKQMFYYGIPPYIVEILVVAALILMAFVLSVQNINNNSALVASFAIVVAALFRIAPALNRIQSAVNAINSTGNFVKQLNDEYEKCDFNVNKEKPNNKNKLEFNHSIRFENVCFSYNSSKQVLKNVSFAINKGDFIGIIGLSGAGKSTLADVMLGLLPADSGNIYVDGNKLTDKNYSSFRQIVGYVPQQINILDKSIAENVAWGCEKINERQVIKSLEEAKLYDVICEYENGIYSNIIVGSNGLSQGQKQRLAIARALYRNPEIILLDEATSSLDVQVEKDITDMLSNLCSKKTIIAIAHRLSTLKACNKLVYMKNGNIVDIGTFDELSSKYNDFENLVKLSNIN